MWFCPFLTFSLLLLQWSVLVGLSFLRLHRAVYLHRRNLRAENRDAASRHWEPPDDLSLPQNKRCLPLLQTSPMRKKLWSARGEFLITAPSLETMTLTCHHFHQHLTTNQQCWMPTGSLTGCAIRTGLSGFWGHCSESWIWVTIFRSPHAPSCQLKPSCLLR